MDDILAKHLTSTLLLLKNEDKTKTSANETIIPFYSYKIIDNFFHIKTDGSTIVSENVGYWKDKPVLSHNNNKYVLLQASSNIVRIDNLGITEENITSYILDPKNKEEEISKNLLKSIKNIITTSKPVVKQKEKPVLKKPKIVKNDTPPVEPEIKLPDAVEKIVNLSPVGDVGLKPPVQPVKQEVPSQEEIVKNVEEITPKETSDTNSVISHYVKTLKKNDQEVKKEDKPVSDTINYVDNGKPKSFEEELFSLLDSKRDDPRIKRLFSHYTEQTKKEVYEINEKYSKQYLAKLLENSGGGGTSNSAVDYAKGGTIDGDLTITSNLSVLGTVYGNIDNKRVLNIGNGTDTDYVIDHNLNTKDLVITIYDENDEVVLASIKNINLNQTLVTFDSPVQNVKVVIIR